jgi:hypothetical protein
MRLIEIADAHGKTPTQWVNVDHVVSVTPTYSSTGAEESVSFELKLDGVPLQRFGLGSFRTRSEAESAFDALLKRLQG